MGRPTVYNEGVNGFHLWTVVTDGYGNFITEDMHGKEIARVKGAGQSNHEALRDLVELTRLTLLAQDPNREAGDIPADVKLP